MKDTFTLIFIEGILLYITASISQLKSEVARIQRTLNKITKQGNVANEIDYELKRLILGGKEVEAIKRYRFETGADLIEAKKYIDSLYKSD